MALYIWEIAVCFYETLLVTYLFYKKLGFQTNRTLRLIISVIIMTSALSILTFVISITILRMALILIVFIFVAVWAFDCTKLRNWYKAIIWPSCVLVIVALADSLTFTIAEVMTDYPLEELMVFSAARFQFTLIYLLVFTVMVWAVVHLGEPDPELPFLISISLFIFLGMGIFATESILDISLVLRTNHSTSGQAAALSSFCYFIILMLFALLVTYEFLGIILSRNRRLKQQQQLAIMEQQQYDLIVSATESLRQWKHDYQGQLRLIGALIDQENYSELRQFLADLISDLPSSVCLLHSGNLTVDAVISLRMTDALPWTILPLRDRRGPVSRPGKATPHLSRCT